MGACVYEYEGNTMKLIIATIKPFDLKDSQVANWAWCKRYDGDGDKGFGAQSGHTEICEERNTCQFHSKVKLSDRG